MHSRCLRTAVDLAPWSTGTHTVRFGGARTGLERRRLVASSEPRGRADGQAAFEAPQPSSPAPSSSSPPPAPEQERPKGHFLAAASVGFGVALVRVTGRGLRPPLLFHPPSLARSPSHSPWTPPNV